MEDMAATRPPRPPSPVSTTTETVTGGLRLAIMTSTTTVRLATATTGDRGQRREIEAAEIIIDTKVCGVIMTGGAAATGTRTGTDPATTRATSAEGQPRPEHIEGQTTENRNGESFQSITW